MEFPVYKPVTQIHTIDFMSVKPKRDLSIKEKVKSFVSSYMHSLPIIYTKIGDKTYTILGDYYDSTSVYNKLYSFKVNDGFCFSSIHEGTLLFIIEIGEYKTYPQMRVNYINRFSLSHSDSTLSDTDFVTFLVSLAHYFGIYSVVLYSRYTGCVYKNEDMDVGYVIGNYCADFYAYLKEDTRRFEDCAEIVPKFSYEELDDLKTFDAELVLRKSDRDELFQVYQKSFLILNNTRPTAAAFFVWLVENACHFVSLFVARLSRYYKDTNPFNAPYYILDAMSYLYNRNLIPNYIPSITIDIEEEYDKKKFDSRFRRD
jgi:hypothetical protein